jgi:hypothetical protein
MPCNKLLQFTVRDTSRKDGVSLLKNVSVDYMNLSDVSPVLPRVDDVAKD